MTAELNATAAQLLEKCRAGGIRIATAESCTGGLVAAVLTSIAGSSDVVECGFVTYSNAAKHKMLGVPANLIETFGAVSRQCAIAMAEGALINSAANLSVAITGIAGPGGGTAEKPVGLVHFATQLKGKTVQHHQENFGNIGRDDIRNASVAIALRMLMAQLP